MNSTKARKPKSPPVPSRTLKDAFDDVKKLYNTYTHGSFSKAEVASTLGVSASSGPFAARFFTLREYGLIEGSGDSYKVSPLFMDMNGGSTESATFKRRALEALKRSEVFNELLSEWKTKLPPRDAVANRLEQQKRFNPDRAKAASNVLEQSLRYAGILDSNNNILPIRDEADGGGEADQGGTGETSDGDAASRASDGGSDRGSGAALRTEIPLGDGRRVVVSYPTDLTEQEAQKVGNVLKAIVA